MKSRLPLRDGVGASHVQLPVGDWPTVLTFLQAHFPGVDADTWRRRMNEGLVLDASGQALGPDTAYRVGADVYYYRDLPPETPIPFEAEVLHQDAHLLVADKPHFLPVTPTGRYVQQCLLVRLKRQLGLPHLVPLHRIDRGTAGIVVFSVNPESRSRYQSLFPQRAAQKHYEALAPTLPPQDWPQRRCSRLEKGRPFFRMQEVAGPANTETRIEVLESRGAQSLYGLQPVTGKTHQLRVHMAALGAPIIGDRYYPELLPQAEDDYSQPLRLLARAIRFDDPLTGESRLFESTRRL